LPFDVFDENNVPKRKEPEMMKEAVRSLQKTLEKAQAAPGFAQESERVRRILQELRVLNDHKHPDYEIFTCARDIGFWKILMKGPNGTPYAGGVWLLYCKFPNNFPLDAPEIRFETPIRHCNVSPHSKICHSVFTRNWTSDTEISTVLNCVYGLLLTPEVDDPVDTELAAQYYSSRDGYTKQIEEHTKKYAAKKSFASWRLELIEDEDVPEHLLCKVCMTRKVGCCLIPCGCVLCGACAEKIKVCPFDRKDITQRQKINF